MIMTLNSNLIRLVEAVFELHLLEKDWCGIKCKMKGASIVKDMNNHTGSN